LLTCPRQFSSVKTPYRPATHHCNLHQKNGAVENWSREAMQNRDVAAPGRWPITPILNQPISASLHHSTSGISTVLLGAEDGVLGGFGDAELHHALGRNLDRCAGGRVAANAGGAVHQDQLAQARQRESVLGLLVSQLTNAVQD